MMERRRKRRQKRDKSLDEVIARYALLVTIAIVSSVFVHAFLILFPEFTDLVVPIDDMINIWCIILINKVNNKIYKFLCYPLDKIMKCCCCMVI